MTETVRPITPEDKIEALYSRQDFLSERHNNIVPLVGPLCQRSLTILDDVQALLEHPATRALTQDIMSSTLQHIAHICVPNEQED